MTPESGASTPETSPFETAPADNEQELARLVRSIQFAENFTVLLAVCNDRKLRETLIARMKDELPGREFTELAMFEPVENLYRELQTRLEEPGDGPPPIIMVYGIEAWLLSGDDKGANSPFVANLNVTRNHFEKIMNGPLVLWLSAHGLEAIALGAPDFFSVRSTVATFASSPAERKSIEGTLQTLGLSGAAGLSFEEKNARADRLLRMLAEFNELPEEKRDPAAEKRLLSSAAEIFFTQARYAEAEPLLRRVLKIDEAAYGPEHNKVASDLNNLAQLFKYTNRMAEAEPLMRRALEIGESTLGHDHPVVAIRLNNLAQLLQYTNRAAEAEPYLRRALEIDEAAFGPVHQKVALRLNNIAILLQDTNRMAEAEPLYRRALEISEAAFGTDHPYVATSLNNLAQLLKSTNRMAEAEPLMRRALEIDEAAFGPDHPDVANRLNNLACLLQFTGRLAEAEPLMRRSLKIDEATYGPEHPDVAIRLGNLAMIEMERDNDEEAELLLRRALRIFVSSYDDGSHPYIQETASRLHKLGIKTGAIDAEADQDTITAFPAEAPEADSGAAESSD